MDRIWTRFYDPYVPHDPRIPPRSLPEVFRDTAVHRPDWPATIFHDRETRYGDLWHQIRSFAAGLRGLGIQKGERVAIELPNLPQFVVAYYGALLAGAIVVPVNPMYTQHELEFQLADAGAVAIITLDQLFPRAQAALPFTDIRLAIVTGVEEALPAHLRGPYLLKQRRDGVHRVRGGGVVHRFSDLLHTQPLETDEFPDPHEVAVLQYTGGTTGRSKGAMLTHLNLAANAEQAFLWQAVGLEERFSVLCATPFFHVYGMTIGMNFSVRAGAAMLLVPRFDPREVAHLAQKHHPWMFPGVPTMYLALSRLPNFSAKQFGSLRVCISGAAPLAPEIQRCFEEVSSCRLVEGYGLTEAAPVTHCNPVQGYRRPGTIGVPFPATDAMITDPDTWEALPPGTIGEMTVRGPQVMQGYWNRPDETEQVLRDGWLHTGDMAVSDAEGYFTIVERKKDIIIASGFNVYPREVEDVLFEHPRILEAAVIGTPNAYRGETVKAVVVLKPDMQATEEEIIAFCRKRLASFKAPTTVEFRESLPKSMIGKVLRRELRTEPTGQLSPELDRAVEVPVVTAVADA